MGAPHGGAIRARFDGVRGLPRALAGASMGTTWSARLAAPVGVAEHLLRAAIQGALDEVVAQMSHWEPDSDITRYNGAPSGWVALPAAFRAVLDYGLHVADATDGAYDPAIGALVRAWGFGPRQRAYEPPSGPAIEAARQRGGWRRVRREGDRAWQDGGVQLDLSAIAKGYGVDRAAWALDALGVRDYLVEVGGELRARGNRPDGQPWRVAVEWPDSGAQAAAVVLRGQSIATSGDYRRYFLHKDDAGVRRRYSHTLDPRNGRPVDNDVASVTVLHPGCMQADAWATALTVLGLEAGLQCARRHGLSALFIVRARAGQPQGLRMRATPGFLDCIEEAS
ncbi:thiamine biosynthesis protein ApbE [Bordetella genomosp. 9]|uniref:FAD:protein FMN transferase n=1 Tax=Bordetella genomosp. 9 TaxID=1416803 RepID=A0A261R790_9BORD|nr:thiamine biosynthesis protein ApbE [Bordetella genomosp. 9]